MALGIIWRSSFRLICIGALVRLAFLLASLSISLAAAQIPAGVLIDKVLKLKQIIIIALSILVLGWLALLINPVFYTAVAAEILIGTICAIFMPAIASLSLSLVGLKNFDVRLGRNGVYSHIGNVLTAILVTLGIALASSRSVLVLFIFFALFAIIATLRIDDKFIDYTQLRKGKEKIPLVHSFFGGFTTLLGSRTSILFTIAALSYTFADASMQLLMVQHIVSDGSKAASMHAPIAFCLTELVMIPVCYMASKYAYRGRKPLLIISYIFLFVRGVCFSLISNPDVLVGIQVLDGISAGIFSLMLILVISDLSINTGKFNATLTTMGMLFTLTNGASNLIFGLITGKFGFSIAFSIMAACAACGGILIWTLVPETVKSKLEPSPAG